MSESSGTNGFLLSAVVLLYLFVTDETHASPGGVSCTYEGHLKTDRNWFGYLANVSIVTMGRMTFQFVYHAERCCQNVLFYSEDQAAILNARMNCWQKEYLLRPEDDQILRLTPRFSWSGCHVTHPNGVATYVCEGGRSFTVDQHRSPANGGPTTWFIAVSNCAALRGLELQYRLVVYGHVGECRPGVEEASPALGGKSTSPGSSTGGGGGGGADRHRYQLMRRNPPSPPVHSSDSSCVLEGRLNTSSTWYGFLTNVSLARGGGLQFKFTYPAAQLVQNVLLYNETDVGKLTPESSCWQKQGVIHPRHSQEKILDLSFEASWNGCVSKESGSPTEELQVTCQGERWYEEPRKIFMAVSNCISRNGLYLHYRLEVFGFTNEICSAADETMMTMKSKWLKMLPLLLLVIGGVSTSL